MSLKLDSLVSELSEEWSRVSRIPIRGQVPTRQSVSNHQHYVSVGGSRCRMLLTRCRARRRIAGGPVALAADEREPGRGGEEHQPACKRSGTGGKQRRHS